MGLRIREVTIDDLNAVTEIEATCFPPSEAASRRSLSERIAVFPTSFLIAEWDGIPVGLINGSVTERQTICDEMFADLLLHQPDASYQSIFGLDVLPAYRKQGIAASLMRALIDLARTSGRKGLILTCKQPLISYYERFGYRSLGRSESSHGGAVWYDMLLAW